MKHSSVMKGAADWSDTDYLEYIKSKVKVTESGCWEWQGVVGKPPRRYGKIGYRGRSRLTHRVVYSLVKGPLLEGLVVMHKCDNQPCCNPDHLVAGTYSDNNLDCSLKKRHRESRKTHCKHGHEFTPENTKWHKTAKAGGIGRTCRECVRIRAREAQRRKRLRLKQMQLADRLGT